MTPRYLTYLVSSIASLLVKIVTGNLGLLTALKIIKLDMLGRSLIYSRKSNRALEYSHMKLT